MRARRNPERRGSLRWVVGSPGRRYDGEINYDRMRTLRLRSPSICQWRRDPPGCGMSQLAREFKGVTCKMGGFGIVKVASARKGSICASILLVLVVDCPTRDTTARADNWVDSLIESARQTILWTARSREGKSRRLGIHRSQVSWRRNLQYGRRRRVGDSVKHGGPFGKMVGRNENYESIPWTGGAAGRAIDALDRQAVGQSRQDLSSGSLLQHVDVRSARLQFE